MLLFLYQVEFYQQSLFREILFSYFWVCVFEMCNICGLFGGARGIKFYLRVQVQIEATLFNTFKLTNINLEIDLEKG